MDANVCEYVGGAGDADGGSSMTLCTTIHAGEAPGSDSATTEIEADDVDRLVHALSTDDSHRFKALLDSILEKRPWRSPSLLAEAAGRGNTALCAALVDHGARDPHQMETAMQLAARNGHADVCAMLAARGARVNNCLLDHATYPLFIAAHFGHENVCRVLVGAGAKIFDSWMDGTALHCAARAGHAHVCVALCSLGCPVDIICAGRTPLQCAAMAGHTDVCGALLDLGAKFVTHSDDGVTALHFAVKNKHFATCQLLLERGAPFALDAEGKTPLYYAAVDYRDIDICKLLAKFGACRVGMPQHASPMHGACAARDVDMCKFLAQQNTVVLRDEQGNTLAHVAARVNSVTLCEMFCTDGDVIARNKAGDTPLHVAAAFGSADACKILLQRGAGVSPPGERGSPLEIAVRAGYPSVRTDVSHYADFARVLLERSAEEIKTHGAEMLVYAVNHLRSEMCTVLIGYGASPASRDGHGRALIHVALKYLQHDYHDGGVAMAIFDICAALLKGGAPHCRDGEGNTPLHAAILYGGSRDLVSMILENGAPHIPNAQSKTPFFLAVEMGRRDVCALFIERKVPLDSRLDASILHVAAHRTDLATCQALVEYGARLGYDALGRSLSSVAYAANKRELGAYLEEIEQQQRASRLRMFEKALRDPSIIPAYALCPISKSIIVEAVTLHDGSLIADRSAFVDALRQNGGRHPFSGMPCSASDLRTLPAFDRIVDACCAAAVADDVSQGLTSATSTSGAEL